MPAVLLIEDDEGARDAFARVLRHSAYDVTMVDNGIAALNKLGEREYDVVVCDFRMPELGGQGFFEQVEERDPSTARRVVFVTAYADDPRIRAFLELTGQPVLSKPVENHELLAAVQRILARNKGRPSSPGYGL